MFVARCCARSSSEVRACLSRAVAHVHRVVWALSLSSVRVIVGVHLFAD